MKLSLKILFVTLSATLLTTPVWAAGEKQSGKEPVGVSGRNEVQLRNVTPSVKSVSIRTQGDDDTVIGIVVNQVKNILQGNRLSVEREVVGSAAATAPKGKVYENLEILINVQSPAQHGQSHKVSVTLQEEGSQTQGEPQFFDYFADNPKPFRQALEGYLVSNLGLTPAK